ncbi:hypothetical protein BEWA_013440 [Theileria equi strain WA]|uniref:Signal peptide containing protein n=1 Tax=Theileria equi strain WA TaxID=1537102 RepID=L1LC23_THEEQ|nr:hypothetical protein BEWA_013440 [Theileria equi strain WA]EKX72785.1 hypothetical protein BEWA_013440 [Theileria equi strain WA]|eukprot:XP_004832237.1 hypothetical protein BEWA_013440 [Theileria equi strain WA]
MLYRYHDDIKWQDGKEEDHKKNLNALKTEAKNHPIAKQQPAQLAPQQAAKPNTQAAPQGPPGQTQAKPVESPEKESTESKELSQDATTPVPQSSEHVNTTLDISKREDTNVGTHYYHSTYEGPVHDFKLKSATVTKVVDAGVVIWEAPKGTNHKCTWAQITVKNGKETLRLEIQTGKEEQLWFRKRDGKWRKLVLGSSPQKSPNPTSKSHTN